MKQRISVWSVLTALALGLSAGPLACQEDDDHSHGKPIDEGDTSTYTGGGSSSGGSSGTGTTDSGTDGGTTSQTGTNSEANCGNWVCVGHGSCKEDADGVPYCECDEGYINNPQDAAECIVDEQCVQLRFLEDWCRQYINWEPAVALFFALDFCSGTAVTPEKFEQIGLEFKILEDGTDVEDNVESYATVVPKPVESYVAIALDVSDSITDSEDLPALTVPLKEFVASLKPGAGEPDVNMAVYIFGKNVEEWIGWTTDLDSIVDKLTQLETSPQSVVDIVGGGSTALHQAVERAIHEADRIRLLRHRVTNGGVLGTGTVVVVTDGDDQAGPENPPSGLISTTLSQLISIGIGHEIDHGEILDEIGRDGSFLSPEPEDWATAFAEITERVEQYPQRSYLLGYCSPATTGSPTVEITVEAPGVEVKRTAGCKFNADLFSPDPGAVCDQSTFEDAVACAGGAQCGGLTACGACPDDQCCSDMMCQAPEGSSYGCRDQNELCYLDGEICLDGDTQDDPDMCTPPPGAWEECDKEEFCDPGVTFCYKDPGSPDPGVCVPVYQLGEVCEKAVECATLHCEKEKPTHPTMVKTCQPPARMYDDCSANKAICEHGTYCSGSCTVRKWHTQACSSSAQCHGTYCGEVYKFCGDALCFWSWDEKINY
jgi:hypothetical protein